MGVTGHQDMLLLLLLLLLLQWCACACACGDLPDAAVEGANKYAVACFIVVQGAHHWRLVTACISKQSVDGIQHHLDRSCSFCPVLSSAD
jgi:hypothetical protein